MWVHMHPVHTPMHPITIGPGLIARFELHVFLKLTIKRIAIIYTITASVCVCVCTSDSLIINTFSL